MKYVSSGKHLSYYHVVLALQPDMFELIVPVSKRQPKYTQSNGYEFTDEGQFEIFLWRDRIPVSAPTCRKYLILRTPATMPSSHGAVNKIAKKRELFEAIRNLKTSSSGSMNVVVELNPYVYVVRTAPLKLELTGCNVFFRQSKGEYVDYVGPLER